MKVQRLEAGEQMREVASAFVMRTWLRVQSETTPITTTTQMARATRAPAGARRPTGMFAATKAVKYSSVASVACHAINLLCWYLLFLIVLLRDRITPVPINIQAHP